MPDYDTLILAMTVSGEALHAESAEEQYAIAHVARNRQAQEPRWRPRAIAAVCLSPGAFPCWNPHDPVRVRLDALKPESPELAPFLALAAAVLSGQHADPTHGATHYHAVSSPAPSWAYEQTPCARIGHRVFYRLEYP